MFDSTTHIPEAGEHRFETVPLSPLEITGAVSAKVMHDLSNLVSGIVGNAEYAARMTNDPASLLKAVEAISNASNAAGKLLGQCLPLQQSISRAVMLYDVNEMAERIAEGAGLTPGWRSTVSADLSGQIKVQPRWLAAAIWQIARETQVSRGDIEFACGPAGFPIAWHGPVPNPGRPLSLFQITLCYRSEEMLVSRESPVTPERPGLLAAFELIRRCKGQLQSRPKPPGRQEISVLIPLV